jgi:hypothetical protein
MINKWKSLFPETVQFYVEIILNEFTLFMPI